METLSHIPQEYLDDRFDSLTWTVYALPEITFEVFVNPHQIGVPSGQILQEFLTQIEG